MKAPLVFVRNDPRTPLEKAVGVDPDMCKDRLLSPTERALEKQKAFAKETLLKHGMRVIEHPDGKWTVLPEYPAGADAATKQQIDDACLDWMRRVRDLKGRR